MVYCSMKWNGYNGGPPVLGLLGVVRTFLEELKFVQKPLIVARPAQVMTPLKSLMIGSTLPPQTAHTLPSRY